MPSNGIQVSITGEITPTNINDNYPVSNPYWGLGGLRAVTDILDRDSITVSRRESGMLVYVLSNGRYYKLNTGLSNLDWVDLGTTLSGSSSFPKVRTIYLVGDSSDVTLLGGVSNNVYNSFQQAYDAANTLQIALGGANIVNIQVFNTTAAQVGNLILTTNYNPRVTITGINIFTSILGNITSSNNLGNSYNIGTQGATTTVKLNNVRIGNIITSATGPTGNSGRVCLQGTFQVGNITTTITDPLNTLGNGGLVFSGFNTNGFIIFGSITTSSQGPLSLAGDVQINGTAIQTGTILTANNNQGGLVTLTQQTGNIVVSGILITSVDNVSSQTYNISNSTIGFLSIISNQFTLNLNKCTVTIAQIESTDQSFVNVNNTNMSTYTTNDSVKSNINSSSFEIIYNLGNDSVVTNSTIIQNTLSPSVSSSGSNVIISNSTISGLAAIFSDQNLIAQNCVIGGTVSNNIYAKKTIDILASDSSIINLTDSIFNFHPDINCTLDYNNGLHNEEYTIDIFNDQNLYTGNVITFNTATFHNGTSISNLTIGNDEYIVLKVNKKYLSSISSSIYLTTVTIVTI